MIGFEFSLTEATRGLMQLTKKFNIALPNKQHFQLWHPNWRQELPPRTIVLEAFVLFAITLMCEGIEGESSHSLLTWPMAKLIK